MSTIVLLLAVLVNKKVLKDSEASELADKLAMTVQPTSYTEAKKLIDSLLSNEK